MFDQQRLSLWKHINQVQSHKWIWYSLNIDMCDVCEYQQWDSPKSNVKLRWSIQPSHTQIALGKLTYLNYRNMHIWPPTKLDYITCEAFHLAPYTSYHLIFLNQYISLWDWFLKFFIFQFDELAFGFLGIIHFILRRFPFFLVKILVCATGVCSSLSLFIWRFTFVELLSKNRKIKE